MYDFLLVVQTIVVLLLIGIILIQRSDSDGFGTGSGSGNQFMTGRASASLLTRSTAILATIFIILSLVLAKLSTGGSSSIIDIVEKPGEAPISAPTTSSAPLIGADAPQPGKSAAPASVPKPE